MGRTVGIGLQDYESIRKERVFYVDKTDFIREWWESGDSVTLLTRPRRFGKTLTMSMMEQFFSLKYAGRADLFEGLAIWEHEKYRLLQGTYPVISLTFANVKEKDYRTTIQRIGQLLASGYLKVKGYRVVTSKFGEWRPEYELSLTNFEVRIMFRNMVHSWFGRSASDYNGFIKALLQDDLEAMNAYMNRIALETFSYFDTGKGAEKQADPERFYHGFLLGLMVDLTDRYIITSNRESGFGRYDVMLRPRSKEDDAVILEFKVRSTRKEPGLEDTAQRALDQIGEKGYEKGLIAKGVAAERIRKYGFAFEGKNVFIKKGR